MEATNSRILDKFISSFEKYFSRNIVEATDELVDCNFDYANGGMLKVRTMTCSTNRDWMYCLAQDIIDRYGSHFCIGNTYFRVGIDHRVWLQVWRKATDDEVNDYAHNVAVVLANQDLHRSFDINDIIELTATIPDEEQLRANIAIGYYFASQKQRFNEAYDARRNAILEKVNKDVTWRVIRPRG